MKVSNLVIAAATITAPLCCYAQAHGVAPAMTAVQTETGARAHASVQAILAQAKAAMGGAAWDGIHSLRTEGTVSIRSAKLSGMTAQLDDMLTSSSVTHNTFGPIDTSWGVDGQTTWMQSPGGSESTQGNPVLTKMYRTRAYQALRAWWYPSRWPAQIESMGRQKGNGTILQLLKITPRRGDSFQMAINARTHVIVSFTSLPNSPHATVTSLSNYRTVGGVKIPFYTEMATDGKTVMVTRLKGVTANVPIDASDFALPKSTHGASRLVGAAKEITIPFRPLSNWVYIAGTINGHPLHFLLDSDIGALDVVTPEVAAALGLKIQGSMASHAGAGAKSYRVGFAKANSLALGGKLELPGQVLMVMPWANLTKTIPMQGIVGANVLNRFVTQIDYAKHQVTFIEPATFNPANAGTPIPLTMYAGAMPVVEGSIDGLPARFIVDTGNRGTLFLTSPFAKAHDLYARYHASPEVPTGSGAGGVTNSRIARAGTLMIGGVTVHNPLVNLSMATTGAFASKAIDGDIGGRILKRFTVTFDVPNHRLYLKPNDSYGTPMRESMFLNRAGLYFKRTQQGFVVTDALHGSPATEAGITSGDVIVGVNGKPADDMSATAFRTLLRNGEPGTRVAVSLEKNGSSRAVALILARPLPEIGGLNAKVLAEPARSR